jgi:hypothetical protein
MRPRAKIATLVLSVLLLSAAASPEEAFRAAAGEEIRRLIRDELWGHYDVESVSILEVTDHTGEWGTYSQGYGLRAVTARFRALRNGHWSASLNREIPRSLCDSASQLYLLCRPQGHEFSGSVEVDMAFTVDGWRVLSRHHRNRRAFPLAKYLICRPDPLAPDPDRETIRACFGGGPTPE